MSAGGGEAGAYLVYGAAWVAFGLLHSILAGATVKARLAPILGAGYRLAYNIFAAVSFAAVVWIGTAAFSAQPAFALGGGLKMALGVIGIAGWVLMFLSLGGYDLGRFAGTAQLRAAKRGEDIDDDEPLRTGGLHRYVRHPIYSAGFLVLWGAAWTPFGLATAIFGSLYLLAGTMAEERRLLLRYGAAYDDYRKRVPAFIPWRGRAIRS